MRNDFSQLRWRLKKILTRIIKQFLIVVKTLSSFATETDNSLAFFLNTFNLPEGIAEKRGTLFLFYPLVGVLY